MSGLNDALSAHLLNHMIDRYIDLMNVALRFEARFPKQMQVTIVKEEPKTACGEKMKLPWKGKKPHVKCNIVKGEAKKAKAYITCYGCIGKRHFIRECKGAEKRCYNF